MSLQASDSLVVFKPCENAKARLVCFPHAGGGPTAFAAWADILAEQRIEVVAISARGRERRVEEAPLTTCDELVDEAVKALLTSGLADDLPYALYGHSLGALVAYETAARLQAELAPGRPRPLQLYASGHGAPGTADAVRSRPPWGGLSSLSDAQLVEAVQSFGVMPLELSSDPGLMSATLPALRADFMVYEAYTPALSRTALAVPITALGGQEDPVATAEHLQAWERETAAGLHGPHIFPGNHFFINTSQAEVLTLVGSSIHAALDTLPKSILRSPSTVPEVSRVPIYDVVLEVSNSHPEKKALVDTRGSLEYGELIRRADLLAVELLAKHLQGEAGKIVALLMGHDAVYVTCMLGIWKAAGAIIVIEAHFPPQLCKEICEESLTRAAIASEAHASKFADVANCSTLVIDEKWFSTVPTHPFGGSPSPAPEDLAILMMTSGTTGRPKTIAGSHFFMHSGARAKEVMLPYQENDNREAFNVMFVWEVMRPLLFGHTAFLLPDEAVLDPGLFVSLLQKHQCSRVLTTPSLLSTILQHSGRDLDVKLSSMRTWFMCGEVLPMKAVHLFRQTLPTCRLVNDYSSWESGDVAYAVVSPAPGYEPSAVFAAAGYLAPMVCAAIIDPGAQAINPVGVTGELYLGGEGMSFGYHAQPELTATKFKEPLTKAMEQMWPGRWYKTGDAARLVGSPPVLEVRGRIDSTVKIRGFKVGIPVVEGAIQEVTGVASCVVVPVHESPAVVDSLLCFLVPAEGVEFPDLVQRVKQEGPKKIPRWMLPSYFRPLPEGDIFSGGEARKLDRKKLMQFADLRTLRAEATVAASDKAEKPTPEEEEEQGGSSVHAVVKSVWAKALNLSPNTVDLDENFFDLGGHSTLAARIAGELSETYGLQVTVLDIYSHSTLGALLDFLDAKGTAKAPTVADMRQATRVAARHSAGAQAPQLAVAGMAGRFPGADNEKAFWSNLHAACTSATFFSKGFLRGKGLPEEEVNHKAFVPCAYMINDADKFDHVFFGIGRHEAAMMDPQHRVFIEMTWAAIENAGLPPKSGLSDAVVGVFAAAGIDGYMVHHLDGGPLKSTMDPQDIFLGEIGNEKDYIATRVSYLLDFTGPAMNVNSACSSALVAVAQAGFAIAANQCDAAVAGASSITFPNLGYFYQDGLVNSVDGYVRPFDAAADGTVFGDSVASLLLRHADDYVRSTPAWGRVSGFSVTNDGGQKAGYAAPSSTGQSMAIMNAMKMMGEDPWSISYVECHATGTRVGDGIEVRGLMDAFEKMGGKKGPRETSVALGSVKGSIAHANCAAGATGLMKVLLMLQHRELVPTANFAHLNSKIRLDGTPFFVNPEVCQWNVPAGPRRAGVSSFGIGGTNAHAIVEEASSQVPEVARPARSGWPFQLLPLSAKTPLALSETAKRLANDMGGMADPSGLEAAAYTLQVGRTALPLRKALVVPSPLDGVKASDALAVAVAALQSEGMSEEALEDLDEARKRPPVAFVFPGQGSQYFGMAQGLYDAVPLFRTAVDHCCDLLASKEFLGHDLRPILFADGATEEREKAFTKPSVLQPSLFVVEYALARVFAAIGVLPVAVAGHSLGEYAAAVVGGLLTLESAIAIVAARARSTKTLAEDGAMLSVAEWSDEELAAIERGERPGLWLAAVNSPAHAVISGETAAVDKLAAELKAADRKCTKLHVQKAFHSGLIAKAAETLAELGMPPENATGALPVASNYHGGWLTAMHLKDGRYWVNHMRGTVRWRDNAQKLMKQWHPAVVLEVGPGNSLSTLTARCVTAESPAPTFLQAMRHPKAKGVHDVQALCEAIGQLWECGCTVDWNAFHTTVLGTVGDLPQQVRLSSYAFDRTSLWINPHRSAYVDQTETAAPAGYEVHMKDVAVVKQSPRCLVRLGEETASSPAIRAYCLPFASGSATLFAPWARDANEAVEVVALELPGRGGRSEERGPSSSSEDAALLESLCDAILADLRGAQYVLVGFSMGGGLSMDLALRLLEKQAPPPLAIYIAGRKSPAADPKDVAEIRMSNRELASYAFAPPEVAETEEFAEHVVPLLRGDLELDARTERRLSDARLSGRRLPPGVGLEVSCGTSDEVAPWSAAPGWQSFASDPLGLHYYPGGHEFMQEQRGPILAAWKRDALGRLMQRRALEMAMLATQGFPAPAFAGTPGLLGSAARPVASAPRMPEPKEEPSRLPFYAVNWVRTEPVQAAPTQGRPTQEAFSVSLGCDVVQSTLAAAASAMTAGSCIIAACVPTTGLFSEDALEQEVQQCWRFTQLVQHFLEVGARGRLVVLCPAGGTGAMVAGASKAVAMEADELRITRVFLPVAALAAAAEQLAAIMELVARFPHEVDLWVQDDVLQGTTYASRLEPIAQPSSKLPCVPKLVPDGGLAAYVLTGATGGLGKAVVDWLLMEQGLLPEQLVLLRRAGSSALSGSLAQCRVVEVAGVDSSDVLVSSALKEITNITGVFHLAGVLDDGIISSMTRDRFHKVATPKCGMFVALLRAAKTLQWPLQWALGFSSTSSLFGYAGQVNYCAANAVLDQLASFGAAGILPEGDTPPCKVLAINWGPWAEAGMAQVGTKAYEQAVAEGDTPLSTSAAIGCLAAALRTNNFARSATSQFAACNVEWGRSQWRNLPTLDLVYDKSADAEATVSAQEDQVAATIVSPQASAEDFLVQHCHNGKWSKIQGKTLNQLGLDSLEVVQLRNLFNKKHQVSVPLGVFADPSRKVSDLAVALSKHLAGA